MELGLLMSEDEQIDPDGKQFVYFQHKLLQEYVAALYIESQMEENPAFFMASLKSSRDLDRNEDTIEFVSELVGKINIAYQHLNWVHWIIWFITWVFYLPSEPVDGSEMTLYEQGVHNMQLVIRVTFVTFLGDIATLKLWAATFAKIPRAKRLSSWAITLCFIAFFALYNMFWNAAYCAYIWSFIKLLRIFFEKHTVNQMRQTIQWVLILSVVLFQSRGADKEQNMVDKYFISQHRSCTFFEFKPAVIRCLARL